MAEVLLQFDTAITSGGRTYLARVCGREEADGLWEGWIEFVPGDGGQVLRTPRETRQPNRADLEYWSTGLTNAYLEGALERALDAALPRVRPATVAVSPTYPEPAPPLRAERGHRLGAQAPRAILDPFEVFDQGEQILRDELRALDEGHLLNIMRAYDLPEPDPVGRGPAERERLASAIVAAVKQRVG